MTLILPADESLHQTLYGTDRAAAVGLASPTIDPIARPLPKLLYRWRLDARSPSPGLEENHITEWKRAGITGAAHLVRVHLADRIEEQVGRLRMPVLVLRAEDDRLTTVDWVNGLAASAGGNLVTVPGAHAFLWLDPRGLVAAAARAVGQGPLRCAAGTAACARRRRSRPSTRPAPSSWRWPAPSEHPRGESPLRHPTRAPGTGFPHRSGHEAIFVER